MRNSHEMSPARRMLTGVVATSLALAACGSGSDDSGSNSESDDTSASDDTSGTSQDQTSGEVVAGEVGQGEWEGGSFTYASFGATVNEVLDDIFDGFAEQSGASFVGDSPPDPSKIRAQVESGNLLWDIVTVDPAWTAAHCGTELEPWDMSKLDVSNVRDSMSVQECGIPVNTTGWIAAYDTTAWGGDTPSTWADFFDLEKFPGKRAVYGGTPAQALEGALLADGVEPEDMYPLDVDRAFDKFDTIKDELIFYSGGAEQEQILSTSQAAMCMCWHGRIYSVNEAGASWDIIHETPVIATTVWGLLKGAENADVAHAAINYYLGERASEQIQEGIAYAGPNENARPELNDNARLVDVLNPPYEPALESDAEYWAENVDELTDRWITWINS